MFFRYPEKIKNTYFGGIGRRDDIESEARGLCQRKGPYQRLGEHSEKDVDPITRCVYEEGVRKEHILHNRFAYNKPCSFIVPEVPSGGHRDGLIISTEILDNIRP